MKSKKLKITLIAVGSVLGALLLTVLIYVLYVVCSYYRVEDNLPLTVKDGTDATVPIGEQLSLVTYNIGFGAYSDNFSFFMDGGKYARAFSAEEVTANTKDALATINALSPDFVLFQEVDKDGDRSRHVDQTVLLTENYPGFDCIFAQNYDSPYFFYPFHQPIGANVSGIMTFSNYHMASALRRSLPIEESLYKYLDLDRAYTVSELPTENGKLLVLYNVHLSAYTSDGTIADEQLKLLAADMKAQYDKGNYVVAAGDFNKDVLGDSSKYFKREGDGEHTWAKPLDTTLLPEGFTCHSGTNAPTCRNADSPYRADGTDFVLSVDAILISPNVELVSCETIDNAFRYSDHNPVNAVFILN